MAEIGLRDGASDSHGLNSGTQSARFDLVAAATMCGHDFTLTRTKYKQCIIFEVFKVQMYIRCLNLM